MKTFKQFVEQLSIYGQVRHGSTAATATDKSVLSAVDKSLENLPTGGKEFHSAAETPGKTGITGSGYVQYSGSLNPNPKSPPSSGAPARARNKKVDPQDPPSIIPVRDTRETTPTPPTSPIRDTRGTSPIRGN